MADFERPLMAHFQELRWRLSIVVIAIIIGAIIAAFFFEPLIKILEKPAAGYLSETGKPIFTDVTELVAITVKIALMAGFIVAIPVLAFQIIMFVSPGLTKSERRYAVLMVPGALVCFAAGMTFAYFALLPPMLAFLLNFGSELAIPMIRISTYINLVLSLLFWMGLVFETPITMFILTKSRIVNRETFKKGRRFAVVIAFVLGALITPTFDPFNQTLVALPFIILYEAGIWLSKLARHSEETNLKKENE
jgi:sec-independent protein translocase protein TatC